MTWHPDYVSVADLRHYMRISDSEDDAELQLAISAASRAIDTHCNRQFGQLGVGTEWLYTAYWDRHRQRWVIETDDIQDEIDGVRIVSTDTEITMYTPEPVNSGTLSSDKPRPFTRLVVHPDSPVKPTERPHDVGVDTQFGWDEIPTEIMQATLLQASRFHARRFSPYGIAGSPETGSELRLLSKVDADVAVVLSPFVRWWAAA